MSRYLLRLEGVNLRSFVFDTKDLSTVRGGSLALLGATVGSRSGNATKTWEVDLGLNPVTTGASAGLYEFDANDDAAAAAMRDRVADLLRRADVVRHATIVVDVLSANSDFGADSARLLALNRFRQMRSPSVAVPTAVDPARLACDFDGLRPAATTIRKGADSYEVSWSVKNRRDFGRDQKQRFYENEIRKIDNVFQLDYKFTNDLESLAGPPRDDWPDAWAGWTPGSLAAKVAVLYVDGNGFGRLQREHFSHDPDSQRAFDTKLKELRRHLLKAIVEAFIAGVGSSAPQRWANNRGDEDDQQWRLRLETLLWGGDEILWVVPAWLAWWLLVQFERQSAGWSIEDAKGTKHQLFHAAGLVFCHHNAPIHRVQGLAKKLAEAAKAKDPSRSMFAYQVLESFDHVGADFDGFRKRRSPTGQPADLVLEAACALMVAADLPKLRSKLPRNKLHAVARGLMQQPPAVPGNARASNESRTAVHRSWEDEADAAVRDLGADARGSLDKLKLALGGGNERLAWIHLAELWDYVPEEGLP